MAIVFSLPWALLIWSYVHDSYSNFHRTFINGIADVSNRVLLFLVAIITYFWSVSNLWSRVAIASILALVFSLFVGYMWFLGASSYGLGVWLDGLRLSVSTALRASHVRIARLCDRILLYRDCFHPVTTDNGNEHELASTRNSTSVIDGTVAV